MASPKKRRQVNLGPSLEKTVKEIEHAIVVEQLKVSRSTNDKLCACIIMLGLVFIVSVFFTVHANEELAVCQANTTTVVQ